MHKLPLFGAFHALAIDEAGCGAGFARGFLSALDVEMLSLTFPCRVVLYAPSGLLLKIYLPFGLLVKETPAIIGFRHTPVFRTGGSLQEGL